MGHYFGYCDYDQFFTKGILCMTTQSPPLEYAVASFAALVYSACLDNRTRTFAFIYYAEALHGLQRLLNQPILIRNSDAIFAAIALVLQLASIEVFSNCVVLTIAIRRRSGKVFPPRSGCSKDSASLFHPSLAMFHYCRPFLARLVL